MSHYMIGNNLWDACFCQQHKWWTDGSATQKRITDRQRHTTQRTQDPLVIIRSGQRKRKLDTLMLWCVTNNMIKDIMTRMLHRILQCLYNRVRTVTNKQCRTLDKQQLEIDLSALPVAGVNTHRWQRSHQVRNDNFKR